ncbi:MAG: hypothetical protein K2N50_02705, partial [Clostridia bacterium]|nr:hypothetical protein [Clostridia bacterium]
PPHRQTPSAFSSGVGVFVYTRQVEVEHGVGKVNKNYQKYRLTAVIAPESITGEKIWIAFDAWGKDEDTWYAKDISITLSKTSKTACTMYSEKV